MKGKLKKATSSGEEGSDQAVDKVPRKRRQAATVGGDKAANGGGNKRKRGLMQEEAALPILPVPLKVKKQKQKFTNTLPLMHLIFTHTFIHIVSHTFTHIVSPTHSFVGEKNWNRRWREWWPQCRRQ